MSKRSNDPKIYVDTLAYYHADLNFEATPNLLPPRLNSNKKYIENPNLQIPFVDLNFEVPKYLRSKENNLMSFLDYLRQTGWPNGQKPEFVTHKYLLQSVALNQESSLHLIRIDGVIFMLIARESCHFKEYSWTFRHFFTKEVNDDEKFDTSGILRKGVFKASFDIGNNERCDVLYAGKVDAIDDENRHYSVKVIPQPYSSLCENVKQRFYWQSFFSNDSKLIIGQRNKYSPKDPMTMPPKNHPEISVFKVQKVKLKKLYFDTEESLKWNKSSRQFEDGYEDLRNLLISARKTLTEDGEGFVFSKSQNDKKWRIRRDDDDELDEFRRVILMNIPY